MARRHRTEIQVTEHRRRSEKVVPSELKLWSAACITVAPKREEGEGNESNAYVSDSEVQQRLPG